MSPVMLPAVQRVTALPSSPGEGQEVYFATGQNGVIWHLRYDSNTTGSYEWTFVGGNPMSATLTSNWGTTSSTTFVTQGSAAVDLPAITTPLAGDYRITISAASWSHTGGIYLGYLAVKIGGAATSDYDGCFGRMDSGGLAKGSLIATIEKAGIAASTVLQMQARSYDANPFYPTANSTWPIALLLEPIRVG